MGIQTMRGSGMRMARKHVLPAILRKKLVIQKEQSEGWYFLKCLPFAFVALVGSWLVFVLIYEAARATGFAK